MGRLIKLRARLRKEAFHPTWLGALVSPVFIVRYVLFKALQPLALKVKGDVLDFGCGSKPYRSLFSNADTYTGCDMEVSGHDHKDSSIDCFFDGNILPFKSEQFDALVSFEVFEHVFDLPTVLSEMNRVTKKGGTLLISVPFVWAEHEAPYDFARYTSFGLAHVLQEAGYEVLDLRKTGNYVLVVAQLLIAYLSQNLSPKNRLGNIFQLLVIFPMTIFSYCLSFIFPKNTSLFCGSVVLAKKL